MEGWTKSLTSVLVKIYVLLPTGGRSNQVTDGCLCRSLKSYYLRVEGLTKPPASALEQNLSPSIYGWKDEPSHSRVSWSRLKSFYLRVVGRSKSHISALVKTWVFLPTGGRTNQATSKCLGTKFKSFYLQVEGRTKSLMSLGRNLILPTYGWKDEPRH